ncbi:MAG: hypothetical protein ABL957_00530 [Parvularculaceae bacterium]
MRGVSVRKPERSLAICLGASVIAVWAVASGALEMRATGQDGGWPGVKVGVGLVFLILGPLVALNFYRGVKAIADLKAGKRVIARWTVSPAALAAFREADAKRSALGPPYQNWLYPAKDVSGGSAEVIFGDDAVLFAGDYFGLPAAGLLRIGGVQILDGDPQALEFGVALTSAHDLNTIHVRTQRGVVRVPVAPDARAEAHAVLNHFQGVRNGEVAANPAFWPQRRRAGAAVALLGAAAFLIGMLFREAPGLVPLIAAVVGAISSLGGVVLFVLAWFLDPHKKKRLF